MWLTWLSCWTPLVMRTSWCSPRSSASPRRMSIGYFKLLLTMARLLTVQQVCSIVCVPSSVSSGSCAVYVPSSVSSSRCIVWVPSSASSSRFSVWVPSSCPSVFVCVFAWVNSSTCSVCVPSSVASFSLFLASLLNSSSLIYSSFYHS